jgi:DNA-directed RNA polymerase subunit M/transcription elongation factor TFIIS
MPRKSENRRVDIVFSPEQYKVLLNQAEQEGYITLLSEDQDKHKTEGSVAEFLRDHLSWTIPEFAQAAPLKARGKYERKKRETEPRYKCPKCGSLNTVFAGDGPGTEGVLLYMLFECGNCGHRFRDDDAGI